MTKRRPPGSKQLNELMLRYAMDGHIANVSGCLMRGANVDYKQGALATIAVFLGSVKLMKLVLSHGATDLKEAIDMAVKADDDRLLAMMNDYLKRKGMDT